MLLFALIRSSEYKVIFIILNISIRQFLLLAHKCLILLLFIMAAGGPRIVQAQNDDFSYTYKTGVYVSTEGSLPFWFYSNADGKVDPEGTNLINQFAFTTTLVDFNKFTFQSGGNLVHRVSESNSLHFTELYGRAQLGAFQFDAGRFKQPIGSNNHDLSVGSMMVSENAIPIAKISLSNPDFVEVPMTGGYLEFKGLYTHGWFAGERYTGDPYLHQKYLYLRINIGDFYGTGGMVHNVVWAGTDPVNGRIPQSFSDYLRVVTGRGAKGDVSGGEVSNVSGNSVAAYDFKAQYKFKNFDLSITRLFYLEDKVSTRFRSPWDGVWGANLNMEGSNNIIDAVTYEHINTKTQDAKLSELIGRRDYYDNFLYQSGWTHEGRVLGIPLILFDRDQNTIVNNVLIGHHIGVEGQLATNLSYKALATYSRNYGIQDDWVSEGGDSIPKDREDIIPREQFRKDQYSLLFKLDYDLESSEGLSLNLSLGSDLGELYKNNLGIMLGFSWRNGLSY